MDSAYLSALSALAGSAIGAFSSFATTWLTQNAKYRSDRIDKEVVRREQLYGAFIDEVSKLFADALVDDIQDTKQLIGVYSLVSRMRLVASHTIIQHAEAVMEQLITTFRSPNMQIADLHNLSLRRVDLLKEFSEICREDLSALQRG
jgi:hypothetical protein